MAQKYLEADLVIAADMLSDDTRLAVNHLTPTTLGQDGSLRNDLQKTGSTRISRISQHRDERVKITWMVLMVSNLS